MPFVPCHHLEVAMFSYLRIFTVKIIKMWNSLSQLVVSEGSIDHFKKLLDRRASERNTVYRDMGNV